METEDVPQKEDAGCSLRAANGQRPEPDTLKIPT